MSEFGNGVTTCDRAEERQGGFCSLSPKTSFGPIVSLQLGWLCETGVRLDVRDFIRFSEVFAQSFAKL
jgi:hypothetical protein